MLNYDTVELESITYAKYPNGCLVPLSLVMEKTKITTPEPLLPLLMDISLAGQEQVVVFTLDGANQVIKRHIVTIGLANQSQIHPRECFRPAIVDSAVSVIIAHNHPSGNMSPSQADLAATRRLSAAGKLLGIPVLDHIIFHANEMYSLREFYPNLWEA